MMRCDLCGTTSRCLQKEIEGKEFDICEHCWTPFQEKLSGKGRVKDPGADQDHRAAEAPQKVEEYEEVVY